VAELRKWGHKVKDQGHTVIKCAARVGMQVDMTAKVSSSIGWSICQSTALIYAYFWQALSVYYTDHRHIKYSLDSLRPIRTAEAFESVDWLADLPQQTCRMIASVSLAGAAAVIATVSYRSSVQHVKGVASAYALSFNNRERGGGGKNARYIKQTEASWCNNSIFSST